MKPGARVQSAIEILQEFTTSPKAVDGMLKHWGRNNRFAGSKDRAGVGEIVFQVMRRRGEFGARMKEDTPRAWAIGYLASPHNPDTDWQAGFDGSQHCPAELTEAELGAIAEPSDANVSANYPEWLHADLGATFGKKVDAELEALLERAPVDLRVNGIKSARKPARVHLRRDEFETTTLENSKWGLRLEGARASSQRLLEQTKTFRKGEFEVQDLGSQLTVEWAGVTRSKPTIDLCGGGGGKTLALAGETTGRGDIIACDINQKRLENIKPRLLRANIHNVTLQLLDDWSPADGGADPDLKKYVGKAGLVFVDAPCSGSGAWRRHPDAKWRLTPEDLEAVQKVQARILERAAALVSPAGHLVYVTCSVLKSENEAQIVRFLEAHPEFTVDLPEVGSNQVRKSPYGYQLSPALTDTDGFYFSKLLKK